MKSGPIAKARVPPMLKTDRENPKRLPECAETMPAVVGWNMDEPMDPKDIRRSRTKKHGAIPTRGIKTMARNGPPSIKKRVR